MNVNKINNFLVNTGLYIYVPFSDDECNELATLLCVISGRMSHSDITFHKFDAYCPSCKKETVYNLIADNPSSYSEISQLRYTRRLVSAVCTRNNSHTIAFWFQTSGDGIVKIGQTPPVKEILTSSISRYKKLLSNDLIELQTAIQLHSHGVGIGSFVYLRRIFENLIITAFEENKSTIVDANVFYQKRRMEEKIEVVKLFIPPFISSNRNIYGILSKGIHELDEHECLAFFPVLKESIEMILEQKIKLKEEKEKESLLSKAITNISSEINKPKK